MNRILFLSVNRSDYGIWRSILRALKSDPNNFIGLFATGGHLSTVHGQTISEVLQDQFYDQLFQSSCTLADSSPSGSAGSISLVSCNFAQVIDNFKPDFIFVLGDRYEVLAATLVASLYRIPIVHFHGGSVTEGALDDNYRHAISKLSNYHFVECVDFKNRLLQLGEQDSSIRISGAPSLGELKNFSRKSRSEFCKEMGLPSNKPFVSLPFIQKQQKTSLTTLI